MKGSPRCWSLVGFRAAGGRPAACAKNDARSEIGRCRRAARRLLRAAASERAPTAITVRPATARPGPGDGFNAFNLDPRPRDLSDPAFQKKKSDAELADAIRRGGAGVGLSAFMPPWGHTLSARQIDEVVLSVRALRRPEALPAR